MRRIKDAMIGMRGRSTGSPLHPRDWQIAINMKWTITLLIGLFFVIATGTVFAQDAVTVSPDSLTERILTLAETRPIAQIILFALMALTLYVGGLLLQSLRQRHESPGGQVCVWPDG